MFTSPFHRVVFVLSLCAFFLGASGMKCSKTRPLEYPPPPPNVLLDTPTRSAQAAGAAIASYVPAVFHPFPVRIRVVTPTVLFQTRARDRLDARPAGISGIIAYCQMPANNPDSDGTDPYTTIFLSDKLSESDAAKSVGHEISHGTYWLVLTPEMREDWEAVWKAAKARGTLPSEYAATSQYEGFAECALYWYQGKLKDAAARKYFEKVRAELQGATPVA